MSKAIVIGRLILMGVLVAMRWILQPVYFITLILYTLFSSINDGIIAFVAHLQKLNNEQLSKEDK